MTETSVHETAQDGFLLNELSPTEVLEVFAELGRDLETAQLEAVWRGGLRIDSRESALGPRFRPWIPAASVEQVFYRRLEKVLEARAGVVLKEPCPAAGSSLGPRTLFHLLLASGADGHEAAQPVEGEWFLVVRWQDPERVAELAADLRFHATFVRLAVHQRDGESLHFFHLCDDEKRKSSFRSWLAGRRLTDVEALLSFRAAGAKKAVFLPSGASVSQRALDALAALILKTPRFWKLGADAASAERLLAAAPRSPGEGPLDVFALDRLEFVDETRITPAAKVTTYAELEVHSLRGSREALAQLRPRIRGTRPEVGHQLELRPGYPVEGFDRERARLSREIAEARRRLAYLTSLSGPRPRLLRFLPAQLPALADTLRGFALDDVRDGRIGYAFQATEERPEGCHYVLFDPSEVATDGPSPPWRWDGLADSASRFWLDPLWCQSYPTGGPLVFVPEGRMLFPALHSWRPEDMDRYLRDAAAAWFPEHRAAQTLPERPIFLFDGEPGPDEPIRLVVLDRQGFVPLTEQIGWLNDNLILQGDLGGVESLIREMATDVTRRRLAERLHREAEASAAAFREATGKANAAVAADAAELIAVLTQELDRIARQCRETCEEIEEVRSQLRKDKEALAEGRADLDELEASLKASDLLAQRHLTMIRQARLSLEMADRERTELADQVRAKIDQIKATYRRLWERLRR